MSLKLTAAALFAAFSFASFSASAAEAVHDEFYWITQINKASIVINSEEGLLDAKDAISIANGLRKVVKDVEAGTIKRPMKALDCEPALIKASAPKPRSFTRAVRARTCMHATHRAAILFEDVLRLHDTLNKVSNTLWGLAERHRAGFLRDAERLEGLAGRLDRCAMGTTVLNGSSWPLNRDRMAHYLGFTKPVENAYDAGQISSMEHPVELAGVVTAINLHIGHFIEDTLTQYAQSRPWILLAEGGENTYVSTAMPQKRNPGLMNNTRTAASTGIALANGTILRAHNITPGMSDPKGVKDNKAIVDQTIKALNSLNKVLKALVINPERALEELNCDWTSSQEVADVLMREYKLPFRVGHHVASGMVTYAKAHNLTPLNFPYDQMQRIYGEVLAKDYPQGPAALPMSEAEFRSTIDPARIVANRRTAGGPQPAEMEKMLASSQAQLKANSAWVKAQRERISAAAATLEQDFERIR